MEKICRERNEIFEQCFEEVKEGVEKARYNDSGVFFPRNVLVLGPRAAKNTGEVA